MAIRKLAGRLGAAILTAAICAGSELAAAQTPDPSATPTGSPEKTPAPEKPVATPVATATATPDAASSPVASPSPAATDGGGYALTICAVTGKEGTPIPGAAVILVAPDGSAAAITTGEDGCIRMPRLPALKYRVTVAAAGSIPKDFEIEVPAAGGLVRSVRLDIATASNEETIIVEARREQPGETRRVIQPEIARTLPGSQGDALKAIQNLPGLARAQFGGAALIVRGGAPEDTRVFLDGSEIPQLYHFGGLTSVVATEMLQSIDFLPGGFGVRYGRALSGVVDVETRPAREKKSAIIDADIFDASAFAEGAVFGGRGEDPAPAVTGTNGELTSDASAAEPQRSRHGRMIAAGRRSYIDFILPQVVPEDTLTLTVAPRYYDYQLRYDAPTTEAGTNTHVMAYGSDDAFTFLIKEPPDDEVELRGTFLYRTLFHQAQAGITKPLASGWLLSATPAVAYQSLIIEVGDLAGFHIDFTRASARVEARKSLGENLRLLVGSEAETLRVRYEFFFNQGGETSSAKAVAAYDIAAGSVYSQAEILRGPLTIVPGVRMDGYYPTSAVSFDPRFAARYEPSKTWFAKAYLGQYHQPPDGRQWDKNVGNPDLRAPYAIQTGIGGGYRFGENTNVEAELFYKWLDDLVVERPRDPGDPNSSSFISPLDNRGIGRAFGMEILLKRELTEKLYGWIAYTLSKSERASPYEPGGWRPFEFDQTHILTALAGYRLPHGWEAGVRMRYATGNPDTFNKGGIYDIDQDEYVPIPGTPYGDRIPAFHQLDIRVDKNWQFDTWKLGVYLDIQNVYLQPNPEGVEYNFDYEEHYYLTGLPILPSIGFRGEF